MSKSPKISARQIADIGRMIQLAETAAIKHGIPPEEILQITAAMTGIFTLKRSTGNGRSRRPSRPAMTSDRPRSALFG